MSTFEGTLKEKDKTHSAEMDLERGKRERLEELVVTMQRNYREVQQRRVEIGSETTVTVDQPWPSTQPGDSELIKGAGVGGAERFEATTNFRFKTVEDTEMQDDPSVVDSKWQVRSGKGHSSDDSENSEFIIDENGEMILVVSNPLLKSTTLSHILAGRLGTTNSTFRQIHSPSCTQIRTSQSQLGYLRLPKFPTECIHNSCFYLTSESFGHSDPNYANSGSQPVGKW